MKKVSFGMMLALVSMLVSTQALSDSSRFLKHSTSWEEDSNGCELDGQKYPIGEMIAMNRKVIDEHEANGGYVSDGEAIMMKCTYLVNPLASDHPKVGERDYRWVAFSWAF